MNGLELRKAIHALMRQHNVRTTPCVLPLADACELPLELAGIAATTDLDLDRMQLGPNAFGPTLPTVPLYYKHNTDQPAGTITSLRYAADGSLRVEAKVTHPLAARCQAFSYAASVEDYTLHATDRSTFYARIEKATLLEISLTENPSNPNALVTRRGPAPPGVVFYDLLVAKVACLQKMVPIIVAPVPAAPPTTSFRSLVEQMQQRAGP